MGIAENAERPTSNAEPSKSAFIVSGLRWGTRTESKKEKLRSCRAVGAGPDESMKEFVHLLGRQRHLVLDPPDE
jgi:hypothetical protein